MSDLGVQFAAVFAGVFGGIIGFLFIVATAILLAFPYFLLMRETRGTSQDEEVVPKNF